MKLTENRPIAWAVLAVVVVLSLILFGGGKLASQAKAVDAVFNAPDESIAAELKKMIDDAEIMGSIAASAKDANQAFVTAVSDNVTALRKAGTVAEKSDAYIALRTSIENLYSNVNNLALSDTDAADFRARYKNFTSSVSVISHDGYNEAAKAFNALKSGFPASLISALRGVKDAALFG